MTIIAGAIEISDLPAGVSLDGTEVIPADQNGQTIRISSQQIANKVVSDINDNPTILDAFITAVAAAVALLTGSTRVDVPFSTVSGLTINWQVDTVPGLGSSTWASLFGNSMPKPFLWVNDGVTGEEQNLAFNCNVTRSLDDSQITTVVFDWGFSQTGKLSF